MDFSLTKKQILSLLVLLSLVLVLPLAMLLAGKRQEIRKEAFEKTATLALTSSSTNPTLNSDFTVDIMINTQSQGIVVGQMAISYSDNIEFQDESVVSNVSTLVIQPPPNTQIIREQRLIRIGFGSAQGSSAFACSQPTSLFTLHFKAVGLGTATIGFVANSAKLYGASSSFDILDSATDWTGEVIETTERCHLTVQDGPRFTVGDTVTINVTQNPRCNDNPAFFYPSMEVKRLVEGQLRETICTAQGFTVANPTQECTWDTAGKSPGPYSFRSTYGGHSTDCTVDGMNCCDSGYNCETSITLAPAGTTPTPTGTVMPTPTGTVVPTPTVTVIPTPTTTVIPGQVNVKLKIKFSGIDEEQPTQIIKIKVGKVGTAAILQQLDASPTANASGIYETDMRNLSSAVTAGGSYYFLIKGPKHLQTRYCLNTGQTRPCQTGAITLVGGEGGNVLDFTSFPLMAGDLPPQDGVVDSRDATILYNCFKTPKEEACLTKADLNLDGIVNTQDMEFMNNTVYTRWEDE